MKPALVYGADEFFGLSFCEHLLEEGVDIDVKLEQTSDEKADVSRRAADVAGKKRAFPSHRKRA